MDRIEPIRRDDAPRQVPAVAPVARRERRPDKRDSPPRPRRSRPQPAIARDDDGTPHVDVRA
jgi:hypothetical protein